MRARICPEYGATIHIIETASGRREITQVEDVTAFPEGIIFIALANQQEPIEIHDGTVEIPEGATVQINLDNDIIVAVVDVHRNGSLPMIHTPGDTHPNSGKRLFHHINGQGQFGATKVPDELCPVASIWCYDPKNQE